MIFCAFFFCGALCARCVYTHKYVDGLHRHHSDRHVLETQSSVKNIHVSLLSAYRRHLFWSALRKLCPVLNHGARYVACKPSITQCTPFFFKVSMHAWWLRASILTDVSSSCLKGYRFVNVFAVVTTACLFVDCAYLSRYSPISDDGNGDRILYARARAVFAAHARYRPLLPLCSCYANAP